MVRRAYEIAAERHHDQFRSSGDPYLTHLLEVAHILADMRLDATTLTAALLHDAIEDTEYPVARIESALAPTWPTSSKASQKSAASTCWPRRRARRKRPQDAPRHGQRRARRPGQAGDRCITCARLEYLEPEKQQRISRETLELYAPIAHRLGMGVVRANSRTSRSAFSSPNLFSRCKRSQRQGAPSQKIPRRSADHHPDEAGRK